MIRINVFFLATITSIATLFGTTHSHAMEIQVFDRMSDRDQDNYIGVMIKGAEQVLTDAGRADQSAQVEKLFTTRRPGDQITTGMGELELNLSAVRVADADNLVKNPNARLLQVELAMIATLKANGIILPRNYMRVGDPFRPKDALSPGPAIAPSPRPR